MGKQQPLEGNTLGGPTKMQPADLRASKMALTEI
jgi:hypothetical protein